MKKFSFELEKVLEFRDFEKQQAEAELAKALAVETEIQNNINTIAEQYVNLKRYMKNSRDFADIISMNQNINLLNYQKEELLKQLAEAKLVTEEKRGILLECMKKTTALEKMKEAQYEEYKAQIQTIEKKKLDELASIKNSDEILNSASSES